MVSVLGNHLQDLAFFLLFRNAQSLEKLQCTGFLDFFGDHKPLRKLHAVVKFVPSDFWLLQGSVSETGP